MSEITIKEIMDIIEKDKNFKENNPEYDFIIRDYLTNLGYCRNCDFEITDDMRKLLNELSDKFTKKHSLDMVDYVFDIIHAPIEMYNIKTMKIRKNINNEFYFKEL